MNKLFGLILGVVVILVLISANILIKSSETSIPDTGIQNITNTPISIATPSFVIATPKSNPTLKITLTPTPTKSQELISVCKSTNIRQEYFKGTNCFAREYDEFILKSTPNPQAGEIGEKEAELRLITSLNYGVSDMLADNCTKTGIEIYKKCGDALTANIERIKNQILSKSSSDLQSCLNNIGDQKKKDKTIDYYWRLKLREQMNGLFDNCSQYGGSLDSYNY